MSEGWDSRLVLKIAAFAAAGPAGVSLLSALLNWDLVGFFVLLLAFAIYSFGIFALVLLALIKRRFPSALVLALMIPFCGTSCFALARIGERARPHARWLFGAQSYKQSLLAEALPDDGSLRHMEWDGWGFAGDDTVVYLVFDPDDMLAETAKAKSARKEDAQHRGLPCPVWRIQRLERGWYSVVLFSGTEWGICA